jgi:hypothetical protein
MAKRVLTALLLICVCLPALAQNPRPKKQPKKQPVVDQAAKDFLAEYDKARYNPVAAGLNSFAGEVLMTVPEQKRGENKITMAYAWSKGDKPAVSSEQGGALKKLFLQTFQGLWRGITGELFSDLVDGASVRYLQQPDQVSLDVTKGKKSAATLSFGSKDKKLERIEVIKGVKRVETFTYVKHKEKWLLQTQRIEIPKKRDDTTRLSFKYTRHREVNTYYLPTLITLSRPKGEIQVEITFLSVNGKPAQVSGPDVGDLKQKISDFEKGWRKWDPLTKVTEIKKLAEEGGPQVAAVLAKCLGDREAMVRLEVARALGMLKEKTATSALIRALDTNRKQLDVFTEVCKALGAIGDPRAVKPLGKNILGGKRGDGIWGQQAKARINALGSIKHVAAVDELIDLFGKCGGGRWGNRYGQYRALISKCLRKLTGQEFRSQNEWRSWWSKNKRTFRFPEDE